MFKSVLGVEDKSESQEDAITTDSEIKIDLTEEKPEIKHKSNTDGGEGSGNYGHKGRKGSVGGSAKSSASTSKDTEQKQKKKTVTINETKSEESGKSVDKSAKSDIIKEESQSDLKNELKSKLSTPESRRFNGQNKHIEGTSEYKEALEKYQNGEADFPPSIVSLSEEELEDLRLDIIKAIDNPEQEIEFKHIKRIKFNRRDKNTIRASFEYDKILGIDNGKESNGKSTCFAQVHFSNNGLHIIPTKQMNGDNNEK